MNNQQLFKLIENHYYRMRNMARADEHEELDLEHDTLIASDAWNRISNSLGGY